MINNEMFPDPDTALMLSRAREHQDGASRVHPNTVT